ncbi:MAG: apolipoprotein A1/A4/E family protein [Bdellovibrionales bacterium]|nr:apolipoprotein A1/A4/E family protein [Bdellovibrionales bacterium]
MKHFFFVVVATFCISLFADETIGQKTGKAIDNTLAKKDAVQKDLQDSMDLISKDIEALKAKVATSSGNAKASLEEKIHALDSKKQDLNAQLSKLKSTSGKAWQDMKDGMSKSIQELRLAYEKAKKNFSEQ